ncbi:formate dehydrogenase accessory sulfurtransferase FdhD [Sphingomonas desiccabilis]|uniref:Sulfur carrier protein FdhD n=1 Tax=Sphingomonas desiccabilis TaxID=429134 RepID=A0A4Q2ILX9_9SPHN|nr:formate dehydrogenase accessory sulfurtransferase FdhD [Sphingomonas desiccabilis]MBB3912079.1 FdhD protein [Sphingomonas desiccabilis]RXZ30249.1 formate dehydrogenase accessory sulfurtransferase FdhD [Sphingomonas desiccabilis]
MTQEPAETGRSVVETLVSVRADGSRTAVERAVAVERPVAIEFNGLGYAVVMATPADLADFAIGFALSERLIARADEIVDIECHPVEAGVVLRVTLAPARTAAVVDRVRHRVTESSCGLCGIENLEQAIRPLRRVPPAPAPAEAAIFAALAGLRGHQPLNRTTGAVHAAALVAADGSVRLAREDVGRHTAFDKLIGAMLRSGLGWDGGFALLSSRCSYELVEKAALAGCPTLVTISAPTSLAIARARDAGLRLVVLARSDAMLLLPDAP